MKMICGILMLLGSVSAHASGSVVSVVDETTATSTPQMFDQTQKVQDVNTPYSDIANEVTYDVIRFSGRVSEGTCVNTVSTTQCGATQPPMRTEKTYSFGSVVTLTYL